LKNLLAILLTLSASFFYQEAQASAWLQKQDEGELIFSFSYFNSDENFNQNGDKVDAPEFAKNELDILGEYGLTEWLTLGSEFSLQSIENTAGAFNTDHLDLSYIRLFSRLPIYESDNFIFSFQPSIKIPNDKSQLLNPEGNEIIPEIKIAGGYSFRIFDLYSYIDTSAQYRYRDHISGAGAIKNQAKYELSLGLKVEKDTLLLAQLFHDETFGNNSLNNDPGNYDLTKAQFSVAYDFWESLFLQGGAFYHIDGVNTAGGEGLILSLWYKF